MGKDVETEDVVLLQQAARGDGRAFHTLADRHMDRLYRLAISLVGNATDAEDVLQETLAGAYRGLGGFRQQSAVFTWLSRILVIQAAKWRRDRKRTPAGPIDAIDVPARAGGADLRLDLDAALQRVSPQHREVLVLRELEQMSYDEIADVLGIPQGTVESRLFRARSELREKLQAYRNR